MHFRRVGAVLMVILALLPLFAMGGAGPAAAAGECDDSTKEHYFPETQKCVSDVFYQYWASRGGLAQQGYPVSDEFFEISAADGKTYLVQYFQRARFELHPESADPQYRVLLGLLGAEQHAAKYPSGSPQRAGECRVGERFFAETKHCVGPLFAAYWASHGGLAQQGYPISDEFEELNRNGQKYRVQYFERARFEAHPENQAPYDVLLGLLGDEQATAKYPDVIPVGQDALRVQGGTNLSPEPFEDADRKAYYDQGGLRIQVKTPEQGYGQNFNLTNTSAAVALNRLGLNNVRVDLDYTRIAGPADGFLGLGCRMPDPVNSNDGYYFNIGPGDGYYVIYRLQGEEYTTLAGGGTATSPLVQTGNTSSHLRIECVGDRLTLYVNGQKITEAHDTALKGNGVNFGAGTDKLGGGFDVIFKNFTIGIPK